MRCSEEKEKMKEIKEIHNSPISPRMRYSSQIFSDLPAELIHVILSYTVHTFRDLIKFSTINKACKQISDYSLLWIEVKLMFYPPRQFLRLKRLQYFHNIPSYTNDSYYEFIELKIKTHSLVTLNKEIFSSEENFLPVFRVTVQPHHSGTTAAKGQEFAYRLRQWWMNFFMQYQRLYHLHMTHLQYCHMIHALNDLIFDRFHIVFFLTECLGLVSLYLLYDCNNISLSLGNKIGLYLILGLIGFYIVLTLIHMMDSLALRIINNYNTLRLQLNYDAIAGPDIVLVLLTSVFMSFSLITAKCVGSIDTDFDWWMIAHPLWIGSCLSSGLFSLHKKKP